MSVIVINSFTRPFYSRVKNFLRRRLHVTTEWIFFRLILTWSNVLSTSIPARQAELYYWSAAITNSQLMVEHGVELDSHVMSFQNDGVTRLTLCLRPLPEQKFESWPFIWNKQYRCPFKCQTAKWTISVDSLHHVDFPLPWHLCRMVTVHEHGSTTPFIYPIAYCWLSSVSTTSPTRNEPTALVNMVCVSQPLAQITYSSRLSGRVQDCSNWQSQSAYTLLAL